MTQFDVLPDYRLDPPDPDQCPECDGRLRDRPIKCRECGWTPEVWDDGQIERTWASKNFLSLKKN